MATRWTIRHGLMLRWFEVYNKVIIYDPFEFVSYIH